MYIQRTAILIEKISTLYFQNEICSENTIKIMVLKSISYFFTSYIVSSKSLYSKGKTFLKCMHPSAVT